MIPAFATTGLKIGNNLENHRIQGQITITCNDGRNSQRRFVTCRDNYLSPSMRSKFVYDSELEADKVEISYINSRGKTKSKSSKVRRNESKSSFNLWIRSLTQRPMLKSGENILHYKLINNKNVVETGEFTVNVETQDIRTCSYRSYYSSSASDCDNPSMVCGRYFREQNDCL
jgi:hypothetical protein